MTAPDIEIDDGSGKIIVSSEEGETDGKVFSSLLYLLINIISYNISSK